ncbi:MAG: hypothetical protein V4547_18060 [Bacteroidota bacterium]
MIRLKHIRRAVPSKAQSLICMLEDVDRLNTHKFHTTKNLTTTEQLHVTDVMIFTVLADMLKKEIKLPGDGICGNYFTLNHEWGSIIVICAISKN